VLGSVGGEVQQLSVVALLWSLSLERKFADLVAKVGSPRLAGVGYLYTVRAQMICHLTMQGGFATAVDPLKCDKRWGLGE